MELIQVANFLNGRYLLNNIKVDKNAILHSQLLSTFSVGALGMANIEKVYYDTDDFFFAEKGINIYTTFDKIKKELIIRYDGEQVTRIEFLKNIPNFFKLKIAKDDGIDKYFQEITDAIYKVYPAGLNVNIEEYLRKSKPQIRIMKKRDSYRVVNNTGLKLTLSFDICEYIKVGSKSKFAQNTLDVVGDNAKDKDGFNGFLRDLILDYPKIIKIQNNELTVARNSL